MSEIFSRLDQSITTRMSRSDQPLVVRSYADNIKRQIIELADRYNLHTKADLENAVEREDIPTSDIKHFAELVKIFESLLQNAKPFVKEREKKLTLFKHHIESVRELFGGEKAWMVYEILSAKDLGIDHLLEPAVLERLLRLSPEGITQELDKIPYVRENFPETQRESDTKRGLIRFRPHYWSQASSYTKDFKPLPSTNGLAYLRSIAKELNDLQGSFVLLDTAIKPWSRNGDAFYGSVSGDDPSRDPLFSVFQEAYKSNQEAFFKRTVNRFNHSEESLTLKLLPLLKEKIQAHFVSKKLPDILFDVTFPPFYVVQDFLVNVSPESSSTGTHERTSTIVIDENSLKTDKKLLAGLSECGGAGFVEGDDKNKVVGRRGARVALVFRT